VLTASTQANLGRCLTSLNELDAARPLLERALETRIRALGRTTLPTAETLNALAILELQAGRVAAAREHLAGACDAVRGYLDQHLLGMTTSERFAAVAKQKQHLDTLLSMTGWESGADAAAALAWKGQLLRFLVSGREAERSLGTEVRRVRDRLILLRSSISDLVHAPQRDADELERLRAEATKLELELGAAWR